MIELTHKMLSANGRMLARVSARYCNDKPPHVDRVTLDSSISRARYAKAVAALSSTQPDEIEAELLKLAEEQGQQQPVQVSQSRNSPVQLAKDQRREAEDFLRSPELFNRISSDIEAMGVEGERELALTVYVVLTSRLLPTPLKAVVQGSSSSGKTFVVERVAELFPPEAIFKATSLSDQAWYYLDDGAVRHRAVILGEREQSKDPGRIDARRAWRELVASNEATRVVTIMDPATREPRTVTKTVKGPCSFIETTTVECIVEEDASRMLKLRPSESKSQTRCIIARAAREAAGQRVSDEERKAIVARYHAVQRLLAEHMGRSIVVPYAEHISIPADQVVARRVFSHVLAVVQAVALLRVLQKEPAAQGAADFTDYEVAYPLLVPLVQRQLNRVTDTDEGTLRGIETMGCEEFTPSDVGEALGLSDRQARRRLESLLRCGLVQETEASRKNRREYRLAGRPVPQASCGLTTPEDLRDAVEERAAIEMDAGVSHMQSVR